MSFPLIVLISAFAAVLLANSGIKPAVVHATAAATTAREMPLGREDLLRAATPSLQQLSDDPVIRYMSRDNNGDLLPEFASAAWGFSSPWKSQAPADLVKSTSSD